MYTYEFDEPFLIKTHGGDKEILSITMDAPTAKQSASAGTIELEINKGLLNAAERFPNDDKGTVVEKKEDKEEKERIDDIMNMINVCGVDMPKCYSHLKQCIIVSNATFQSDPEVDGGIQCKGPLYDDIPFKELRNMLGWYIVNFINTSF